MTHSTTYPAAPKDFDAAQAKLEEELFLVQQRIYRHLKAIEDSHQVRFGNREARIKRAQDAIDALTPERDAMDAECQKMREEFIARGRWHRYFLVVSSDGHIHREMHCSTCHRSTRFAWLTDLSDCDETVMVEQYGEKACTVCFPDAPTHPAWQRSVEEREAAEAKKNKDVCPGSGQYVPGKGHERYRRCPHCGLVFSVTTLGNMRKHKLPS